MPYKWLMLQHYTAQLCKLEACCYAYFADFEESADSEGSAGSENSADSENSAGSENSADSAYCSADHFLQKH